MTDQILLRVTLLSELSFHLTQRWTGCLLSRASRVISGPLDLDPLLPGQLRMVHRQIGRVVLLQGGAVAETVSGHERADPWQLLTSDLYDYHGACTVGSPSESPEHKET